MTIYLADPETWRQDQKTVKGHKLELIAIQPSSRKARKGRTKYLYHIPALNVIVYNRSQGGVYFMPIATPSTMRLYLDIFVNDPVTQQELGWLRRYGYQLVNREVN